MTTERTWIRGGLERVTVGEGGRWYTWDGVRYWSVTTIIDAGVPKPALINWAKRVTAEYAVDKYKSLGVILDDAGREGAVDWLKDASYREMKRAGNLGTLVHDYAEAYVLDTLWTLGTDRGPDWNEGAAAPYMVQFLQFLDDYEPVFEAVEAPVISKSQRWAGTLDAILTIERERLDDAALRIWDIPNRDGFVGDRLRLLVDFKTGKGVYPQVALQLAGYRYADTFLGGPDASETEMPEVDGCAVLHLRPDGYDLIPIRVDDDTFTTLQYTREMHRWQIEGSKEAVGAPNRPPRLVLDDDGVYVADALGKVPIAESATDLLGRYDE